MHFRPFTIALACLAFIPVHAQIPDSLVTDGIPAIPPQLARDANPYLESRTAAFNDWHPEKRELILTTRFADARQLHQVVIPGGARKQLTFSPEPVAGASYDPKSGEFIVVSQDVGGGEFYQLFRYEPADGRLVLLTDGKSRNTGPRWSTGGELIAYASTRRNGRDTDIYVMNPRQTGSDRLLAQVQGGGWSVLDWSHDDSQLVLCESISINESRLHLCDARSGKLRQITPLGEKSVAWAHAAFARDDRSLFVITDKDSEFLRLCRLDLATGTLTPITEQLGGDVEGFDLSHDGRKLAFVLNDKGVSTLHLLDTRSNRVLPVPRIPVGVITGLAWHRNNRDLGFSITSARIPGDVFSLDTQAGRVERWTESETGGLNAARFSEPELVRLKSFDGLEISGFLYRPDPKRHPGPRPVLVNIHGGPEGQSRPRFQGFNNFYIDELGVAVFFPNVRGSSGFGKTFLTLDNGFKREDTVKDIGAVLDWMATDKGLDASRVAVIGGSYGGYMSLASMVHHGGRLRCGIDIVGISNFQTFLKNTQDYRRDLRRVEYGDERDPEMAAFLDRISPANQARSITKPLFIIQGLNDPRVPASEAEQMAKAIRDEGRPVWYLLARDEGHGFQKKRNSDYMYLSIALFLNTHLLGESGQEKASHR